MKQSVFLKLKNMLCSRMLNCRLWSPQPAASAASAAANPGINAAASGWAVAAGPSRPPTALSLPSPGATADDFQNNPNDISNNRNNSQ